ncbi:MAG TPA: hypothetical protein ENI62_06755, partial [Gammaproteobacteria bacterium]|nr:hypothetical protein [Gammaproteobacteria bacterium]
MTIEQAQLSNPRISAEQPGRLHESQARAGMVFSQPVANSSQQQEVVSTEQSGFFTDGALADGAGTQPNQNTPANGHTNSNNPTGTPPSAHPFSDLFTYNDLVEYAHPSQPGQHTNNPPGYSSLDGTDLAWVSSIAHADDNPSADQSAEALSTPSTDVVDSEYQDSSNPQPSYDPLSPPNTILALDGGFSVNEDGFHSGSVLATDIWGRDLDYVFGQPGHGHVEQVSGEHFQYTPETDYYGPDSFSYTAANSF